MEKNYISSKKRFFSIDGVIFFLMSKLIKHGILLAGGNGTRLKTFYSLYFKTFATSIQQTNDFLSSLLNLILLGVENVCVIINPKHESLWKNLFNNLKIPININIVKQDKPEVFHKLFLYVKKLLITLIIILL